jgi:uncharacterized protein DUF6459
VTVILSGVGERSRWRGAPAPGIRMRRPPSLEPLDERAVPAATGSELPLDWSPAASRAQRRPAGPIAPPSSAVASAQRYVRTCLEVLNGFRPASHLRTLAGPVEFGAVVAQLGRRRNGAGHFAPPPSASTAPHGRAARDATTTPPDHAAGQASTTPRARAAEAATAEHGRSGQDTGTAANGRVSRDIGTGLRPAPAGPTTVHGGPTAHRGAFLAGAGSAAVAGRRNVSAAAQPFRLQRMRVAEPRDGVAEIVAVLSYGGASLAVAMRLERRGESWLCALVQVI